ncbi:DUF1080 domain-containing protein [Opitutia bacterium ISCC 51]|nr:DUF1080 domain-containing protein [Opitutae bacterium ISCC 51]QXD29162.1 DUF1080 domain-containing protein [Opitutae bacterium ISCC 52]
MKFPLKALLLPLLFAGVAVDQTSLTPSSPINLLGDPSFKDFTTQLHPERSLSTKREELWSINQEGILHGTGKAWGFIRTKTKYRDYHLVLEYKWGEHTYGYGADRSRGHARFGHFFNCRTTL